MVESEAQGRLPGIAPISVVDIGSNSVRLVIYEGLNRTPTVLFNEKVLCGLGRGIAATGLLSTEGVQKALGALRRFHALSEQARATDLHVIATAAAREAANGPDFIEEAQTILGREIHVLSGRQEAHYSALGVISSYFDPDGIVGDLGGGSLELVDIRGTQIGDGITLPIGGLRLSEAAAGSVDKAQKIVRKNLAAATLLERGKDRTFYAVGGTWRNLAKLHMEMISYPLHMTQGYEIETKDAIDFLKGVAGDNSAKGKAIRAVSRNRRGLLPFGAVTMAEILRAMKPQKVSFSALGVREGFLYSLLNGQEKAEDPLICAADELAILRARSPEHARELTRWTEDAFKAFGIDETVEEARYRRAACLLADISWRAHPDYRGAQSLNLISNGTFGGITHAGRVYIALANYYRFEGLRGDDHSETFAAIASPRFQQLAKLLGGLLRVSYLFSASMPGVTPLIRFEPAGPDELVLHVPKRLRAFAGERLEGRLLQLSRLTGHAIHLEIGS
ncbi:exopolyphosphatase [Hoeflea prorocentri]|uniref:exopolyphosphatase n=1 Tax=Hoeflea prorocentri TaxID=1922333 RepID=A0A9X3UG74_9HYPH|nr:exopolyphosphatase [Hoeflea prorocentri]MCY6380111.1 exopolyphosphatase [Hoeflea prorocentri]MDA5397911.1 exopolyphosphatase [Hoeflea prorocentri]